MSLLQIACLQADTWKNNNLAKEKDEINVPIALIDFRDKDLAKKQHEREKKRTTKDEINVPIALSVFRDKGSRLLKKLKLS